MYGLPDFGPNNLSSESSKFSENPISLEWELIKNSSTNNLDKIEKSDDEIEFELVYDRERSGGFTFN